MRRDGSVETTRATDSPLKARNGETAGLVTVTTLPGESRETMRTKAIIVASVLYNRPAFTWSAESEE